MKLNPLLFRGAVLLVFLTPIFVAASGVNRENTAQLITASEEVKKSAVQVEGGFQLLKHATKSRPQVSQTIQDLEMRYDQLDDSAEGVHNFLALLGRTRARTAKGFQGAEQTTVNAAFVNLRNKSFHYLRTMAQKEEVESKANRGAFRTLIGRTLGV